KFCSRTFALLEGWDMLSSGHFTFVALTTTGFPGKAFRGKHQRVVHRFRLFPIVFWNKNFMFHLLQFNVC
ncbi:hypothetical protein CDAR_288741, partial [Caerostris darwini]